MVFRFPSRASFPVIPTVRQTECELWYMQGVVQPETLSGSEQSTSPDLMDDDQNPARYLGLGIPYLFSRVLSTTNSSTVSRRCRAAAEIYCMLTSLWCRFYRRASSPLSRATLYYLLFDSPRVVGARLRG
mmetsp:Transcript_31976/g.95767  ORF Transcript_31976/g.95767 Transcript_31976/m.95767 type:complete len:130 (-) Transcript_31976:457-846(-)